MTLKTQLLEQVVLELAVSPLYLRKLKDKVGLISQWTRPHWELMRALHSQGATTEKALAQHRHVTEEYIHHLARDLEKSRLVETTNAGIALTEDGVSALAKLESVVEIGVGDYADKFDATELKIALGVLEALRNCIENDASLN